MKVNYKSIGGIALAVLIVGFLYFKYSSGGSSELKYDNEEIFVDEDSEDSEETEGQSKTSKQKSSSNKNIVVEIKGEVKNPDIYWLTEDNIIDDLIKKAGGLTENADMSSINRAEKLKSNESIIIPDKNAKSVQGVATKGEAKSSQSDLININTATESELDSLPGIGPARAKSIIDYRDQNGSFNTIEDIKNVKGIGDSYFEKLKDKITV